VKQTMRDMQLTISALDSPLGEMLLVCDDNAQVRALDFADHETHLQRQLRLHYGSQRLTPAVAPGAVTQALRRYFDGQFDALDQIVTATAGTDLQRRVWQALRSIPAGQTNSYGVLARAVGFSDARAAIAIGAANGANPIAIIVPCHRVIASNGELRGYAWGLHRKRWLLEHERAIATPALQLPGF